MLDLLSYDFIQRALIIGIMLALSAALLSPFLVLNQQAMIADGLAHVSFAGLALGILLFHQPLWIAIPFVVVVSLLIKYLAANNHMNGDAAIGLVAAVSFAIGLIIVKRGEGFNVSVESMLVGNIFTVTSADLILTIITMLLILAFILIFYRKLFLMTYDFDYAKFSKIKVNLLGYALSALTAFFIVVGVRTIGTLLISAFVIFPSIIASQFTKSFKLTLVTGILLSLVITVVGIFLSHPLAIPVGSAIVVIDAIVLLFAILIKNILRRT